MVNCPEINNKEVRDTFNSIIELFDGQPMSVSEFKSQELRNKRTGTDKEAMDIAYTVWDITDGENIPNDKISILKIIRENYIEKDSLDRGAIKDRLSDAFPNYTEKDFKEIYDNYFSLMKTKEGRENKAMSLKQFKGFAKNSNVYRYKNTFIFGQYDPITDLFIVTASSSPNSKELLAEALPNISSNFDVIGYAPKDVTDKYKRSGYSVSKASFPYNFKGESMDKFMYASNPKISQRIFDKNIENLNIREIKSLDTRNLALLEFNSLLEELIISGKEFDQRLVTSNLRNLRIPTHQIYSFINTLKSGTIPFTRDALIPGIKKLYDFKKVEIQEKDINALGDTIKEGHGELNKSLINYLSNFGIKTQELENIQEKLGIDSLGSIDLLNKIIYVDKNNTEELPEQAGKFIAYMLQHNPLITTVYRELKKQGRYIKSSKEELLDIIGELIAEQLHKKTNVVIPNSLKEKINTLVAYFFKSISRLRGTKINRDVGIIADSVIARNQSLITASKYKPGSPGKSLARVSLKEALKSDKFADSVTNAMAAEGFILTGSTALAEQGTVLRPGENQVHDLDWVNPYNEKTTATILNKLYPNRIHIRDIHSKEVDYYTHTFLISPEGTDIKDIVSRGENSIIESFIVVDSKGTTVGEYKNIGGIEKIKGVEAKFIDLFMNSNERLPSSKVTLDSGQRLKVSNWKDIFKAKLKYARLKDIWDYNRFIPNDNINFDSSVYSTESAVKGIKSRIDKAHEELDSLEPLNVEVSFNSEAADDMIYDPELEDDFPMEDIDENEHIFAHSIHVAIEALNSRIKSLSLAIPKSEGSVEDKIERVDNLKEEIKKLRKEGMLIRLTEIGKESADWVRTNILAKEIITSTDIIQAGEEISAIKTMMNNILDPISLDPKTGKAKYLAKEEVTDKALVVLDSLHALENRLASLRMVELQRIAETKSNVSLTVRDLTSIRDIGALHSLARDASTAGNKVVSVLDDILKDVNRNVMSEYSETIGKDLHDLMEELKASGIDVTKRSVYEKLLQKDSNGNFTTNFVSAQSQDYYDFLKHTFRSLDNLTTDLSERDERNKIRLFSNLINNTTAPNYDKLFTNNATDKTITEETERLIKSIGEEEASTLIDLAQKKFDRFLNARESVEDLYREQLDSGVIKTEADYNEKIRLWEYYKNPVNIQLRVDSKKVSTINSVDYKRFIAFAPKLEIDGKKTEWFDKDYQFILDNPNTYGKFYNFINSNMEKFKEFLPPDVSNTMQSNYLPEVNKQMVSEILKGGAAHVISAGKLFNNFIDSISVEEQETDYSLRDSDGRPINSIPIRYVRDNVGRLRGSLAKKKSLLRNAEAARVATTESSQDVQDTYVVALDVEIKKLRKEVDKMEEQYKKAYDSKSLDVVTSFKTFAMMAINYKRKSAVEDVIMVGKKVLEEAQEVSTTSRGRTIKDRVGKYIDVKDGKLNVLNQFEYEVEAILYNKYKAKNGKIDLAVGLTIEARKKLSSARADKRQVNRDYFSGNIDSEERNVKLVELEEEITEIEGVRTLSASKAVDQLSKLTYLTSLGWNPLSATANVLYGVMANNIEAASGRYFNTKEFRRASKLMTSTTKKSMTGIDGETSQKIRNLMGKFAVMFDLLEDAYGSGKATTDFTKKLGLLNPMEMFKRGEYMNQATVLIATLLHDTVETTDGKDISLWDAFNVDGTMKDNVKDKENWSSSYNALESNSFTKHRSKVIQLIKRTHGNYDPSSPLYAKKTAVGRALSLFKTWFFEGWGTRVEKYRYDSQLGDHVKGRYRTFGSLGLSGSIGMIKAVITKNYIKSKSGIELDLKDAETALDFQNMARNLKELQWFLALMGMYVLANMAFDDDDKKTAGYKFFANIIGRMQGDVTLYLSPQGILDLWKNPAPALRTVENIGGVFTGLKNYVLDDNPNHDAGYMFRKVGNTLPLLNQLM